MQIDHMTLATLDRAEKSSDGRRVTLKEDVPSEPYLLAMIAALGGSQVMDRTYEFTGSTFDQALSQALLTGTAEIPTASNDPFDRYDSSETLARYLVNRMEGHFRRMSWEQTVPVLEPSAGGGILLGSILRQGFTDVTAIESDPDRAGDISATFGTEAEIRNEDFLLHQPSHRGYKGIVMTPPLTSEQDSAHFIHAAEVLAPGGILVSLMGLDVFGRTTTEALRVRALVSNFGTVEPVDARYLLPKTMLVRLAIATMVKPS